MKSTLLLLILTIIFSACSEKPQGVISNAQQQTLDKAKQTEEVLKKADEERLKKIEELTPVQ